MQAITLGVVKDTTQTSQARRGIEIAVNVDLDSDVHWLLPVDQLPLAVPNRVTIGTKIRGKLLIVRLEPTDHKLGGNNRMLMLAIIPEALQFFQGEWI